MRGLFLLVFSLMFEFKAVNKSTHRLNQTEQNKPERIDKDGGDKKKHLYVLRCSAQDEFCLTHFLHKITAAYNTNSWFIKNFSLACNSYWNQWGHKRKWILEWWWAGSCYEWNPIHDDWRIDLHELWKQRWL